MQQRMQGKAIAISAAILLLLPPGKGLGGDLEQDDALRLPLWTDGPVKVDPDKQAYERLPAVRVEEEHATGLSVPQRIRMVDSASFSFDGQTYRIAGIQAIAIKRICHRSNGQRWTCGRMAAIFLGNLVRGKRLYCEMLDHAASAILADCKVGQRNIAEEIIRMGYGRATGRDDLIALQALAISARKGIWENPDCLSDFETC